MYIPCGSPIPWASSDVFYPGVLTKSIDIDIGWPTSLVGGEGLGGSEYGPKRNKKRLARIEGEGCKQITYPSACLFAFWSAQHSGV